MKQRARYCDECRCDREVVIKEETPHLLSAKNHFRLLKNTPNALFVVVMLLMKNWTIRHLKN